MDLRTLRTTWGFFSSIAKKFLGIPRHAGRLEGIFNYHFIDDGLATSGQPSERDFELICEKGYESVINLAPANAENSIKDEAATLASLGLHYVHIPVDFYRPTEKKFNLFVQAVNELKDQKLWIHCAANMRVSAFLFRYRTEVLGINREIAQVDLDAIWRPFEYWKPFMAGKLEE